MEKQDWYLKTNELGGFYVYLLITGEKVGDSAKIESYGDDLFSEIVLKLDYKKQLSQEQGIFCIIGRSIVKNQD